MANWFCFWVWKDWKLVCLGSRKVFYIAAMVESVKEAAAIGEPRITFTNLLEKELLAGG